MSIKYLIPILFVIILTSCNIDKTLQNENKNLKIEIDSLKQIIKKTELQFHFNDIMSRVYQQDDEFTIGKESILDLIISARLMSDTKGDLYNLSYKAKSSNGNNVMVLNNENIIKYTPINFGLDTLFVDFIYYSKDNLVYFTLPVEYIVEIKK